MGVRQFFAPVMSRFLNFELSKLLYWFILLKSSESLKTFISLAFTAILLLNIMGYYGIFLGMQYRNDVVMVKSLHASQYDGAQPITIEVPNSIPYMEDNPDFVTVNGKFEHQGEHYRSLIKQKYAQDTLTVVFVKDFETQKITETLSKSVKNFTGKNDNQKNNAKPTINFIKDYLPQTFSLKSSSAGWQVNIVNNSIYINLIPSFVGSVIHPPNAPKSFQIFVSISVSELSYSVV